jgi:GNAT superfamily N-acetyltransferase
MTTSTRDKVAISNSSIQLDVAEWTDVIKVLSESHSIWGGGLSRDKYYEWVWSQLQRPWSRKHHRFLVARRGADIVCSCKLYIMDYLARGTAYRVAGIGAVYTPERFRGHGYASQMLETIEQRCSEDGFDAMLLYSDIDTSFYERLGYETFSNDEFHIWINDPLVERWIMSDTSFAEDMHDHAPDVSLADPADAALMVRHYSRFLTRRAFGALRTDSYWNFKLQRERFRHENCTTWPALEIMSIDLDQSAGGYALFEQGGLILRVLEVVGSEPTQELLWRHLLRTALLRRVQLIRGWEGIAPSFVKGVKYAERDWGHPMILPINKATESWLDADPSPLLELDHL